MIQAIRKIIPAALLLLCVAPAFAGVEEDFKKAQESYLKGATDKALPALKILADGGYQPALLMLAEDADRGGDWDIALGYYRKLAEKGDAQAEYRIGVFHAFGYAVPQNNQEALNWITRSAEKGNQFAINTRVRAYLQQGLGLTMDPATVDEGKALDWLKRSAETEYVPALEALAQAYRKGQYGLASDLGQAKALEAKIEAIKAEFKKADGAWKGADFTVSSKILIALTKKDYAPAWALLGYIAEKTSFLEDAVNSYRHAAEQGSADGQYFLAVAYSNGNGVKQDDAQALQWMTRAAEQGHAPAISVLAKAYSNKKGLGLDEKTASDQQAVHWLKKAAANDDQDAVVTLLDAYRTRKFGLVEDPEQIGALASKLEKLNPGAAKKTRKKRQYQ